MTNTFHFKSFILTVGKSSTNQVKSNTATVVERPKWKIEKQVEPPPEPFQYWGVIAAFVVAVIYLGVHTYFKQRNKGV